MIELNEVSFSYPGADRRALAEISVRIKTGEFVLVSGPSGSGKSTLLRTINGLVPHFSGGRISGIIRAVGHDPIGEGPAAMSRVAGFVFQEPEAQMVVDTVCREIAFPLENVAEEPEKMRERVSEILNILDIKHLRKRRLTSLSGGERQKVSIAAAMVANPAVLLLDEPTSQLDAESAEMVLDAVMSINKQLGTTVVLVEHRIERIFPYLSRLVVLEKGRITENAEGMKIASALERVSAGYRLPVKRVSKFAWSEAADAGQNNRTNGTNIVAMSPSTIQTRYDIEESKPLLIARHLHYAYGQNTVLVDGSLSVYPGEVLALIGQNGSGKSTLLKCLVGLLQPSKGEILLNGRDIAGKPVATLSKQIAYLPQYSDDLLYADSVEQELATTINNHGLAEADLPWSIDELLQALDLHDIAESYPRDLSVGQKLRTAMGAVMVPGQDLLLLDEPTRGIDRNAKLGLAKLLSVWKQLGKSILLVTHDKELVGSLADRVLTIEEGRVNRLDVQDMPLITYQQRARIK